MTPPSVVSDARIVRTVLPSIPNVKASGCQSIYALKSIFVASDTVYAQCSHGSLRKCRRFLCGSRRCCGRRLWSVNDRHDKVKKTELTDNALPEEVALSLGDSRARELPVNLILDPAHGNERSHNATPTPCLNYRVLYETYSNAWPTGEDSRRAVIVP